MPHHCWVKCLKINPNMKKVRKSHYLWRNMTSNLVLFWTTKMKKLETGGKKSCTGRWRWIAETELCLPSFVLRRLCHGKEFEISFSSHPQCQKRNTGQTQIRDGLKKDLISARCQTWQLLSQGHWALHEVTASRLLSPMFWSSSHEMTLFSQTKQTVLQEDDPTVSFLG